MPITQTTDAKHQKENVILIKKKKGHCAAYWSTLPNKDNFWTGTKCSSKSDVQLVESQIKGVKKGRDQI